jgi:hypothetical protein
MEDRGETLDPLIDFAEFLRVFPLRGAGIMWLVGAGASASAGVPTAGDLIWEFKRRLYCSLERVPPSAFADLLDPSMRARLQQFFDGLPGYPLRGAPEEYASYFEAAFPDERDRRRFIEDAVRGRSPSYGHLALASLLRAGMAEIIWTPNFDTLIEDAVSILYRTTGALTVADLDRPQIAAEALRDARYPLLGKIHGDFRSARLKNTPEELLSQDTSLRSALVDVCRRRGLAIIGYSGRDNSVLDALEAGLDAGAGYPGGLFWFRRSGSDVPARVSRLLKGARALGIKAGFVEVETFDEAMGDIVEQLTSIPAEVSALIRSAKPRMSAAPIDPSGSGWPVIRLNALPVFSYPVTCRLVVCSIGGTREVGDAVQKAGAQVIAARSRAGVLAFGSDTEVRRAFEPFGIARFDLHSIVSEQLEYESGELGLLYHALASGLQRSLPLRLTRYRGWVLAVEPTLDRHIALEGLRAVAKQLTGRIPGTELRWYEAVRLRLELVGPQLWALLRPTVIGDPLPEVAEAEFRKLRATRADFIRERIAVRYNSQSNQLLDAWARLLTRGEEEPEVRALGISDGVDGSFRLGSVTAFTRRRRYD